MEKPSIKQHSKNNFLIVLNSDGPYKRPTSELAPGAWRPFHQQQPSLFQGPVLMLVKKKN